MVHCRWKKGAWGIFRVAQAKTFEVQVSNDNRWTVAEICATPDDGVRVAESLLAAGKGDAVRVLQDLGEDRRPRTIFEKAGVGRPEKPITINAIEDSPVCQSTFDVFAFDARLAASRLMRQFLDEYGLTALELLYDFGRLRQIVRNDVLYPQALHRLAGIQARKTGGKPAERIDSLHRIILDLIERARDNADILRFHAILAEQGVAAMVAAVGKEFQGDYAVYLKGGAVARLLNEDVEWNGKVSLLCDQFERGPDGEALSFLDDALAEILDGGAAVQSLMGGQSDLGSALRNLTLLSYGACTVKGGRNSSLPRLNAAMGRTRLTRSRQMLVGRVERALKGTGPLTRESPQADRAAFVNLIGMLCAPAGLIGGPGMSEAITLRARLSLAGEGGDLTAEEAIRQIQMMLPNRAVRLGYLLDLAHSPFGQKNPMMAIKALAELLAELPDLGALLPAGIGADRQGAIVADLRRRMAGEAIPEELRNRISRRLERLMAGETIGADEMTASPSALAASPAMPAAAPASRPAQTVRMDGQDLPRRDIAAGEFLFRQGEPGDEAYLVVSGEIELLLKAGDNERLLCLVRRGDIIGEMALLAHQPRMASARAKTAATLIAVPAESFQARLDRLGESDRILRRLLDVFAERIRVGTGD